MDSKIPDVHYCVDCAYCCEALPLDGQDEFSCNYYDGYIRWDISNECPECSHFKKDVNFYLRERCR